MASFEQNSKSKLWSVRFRIATLVGTVNKRLSGYKTKKAAQQGYIDYVNENSLIIDKKYDDLTVADVVISLRAHNKSRTKESTQYEVKHLQDRFIMPYFGNQLIKDISKNDINLWQDSLNKKDYCFTYKSKLRMLLSGIFKHACLYYDLPLNPVLSVIGFRNIERKREMQIWSPQQFKQFINVVDEMTLKALFKTLYLAGVRKGEALALSWKDIDFHKNTIDINKSLTRKVEGMPYAITTTKNQSSTRKLLIPLSLVEELEKLKHETNGNSSSFVFGKGDTPLAENTLTRRYKHYCALAGVTPIRLHDFRHSHASLLIQKGESIVMVAKRLGHSSIEQTLNTYAHIMPDEEEKLIKKLELI